MCAVSVYRWRDASIERVVCLESLGLYIYSAQPWLFVSLDASPSTRHALTAAEGPRIPNSPSQHGHSGPAACGSLVRGGHLRVIDNRHSLLTQALIPGCNGLSQRTQANPLYLSENLIL